jgi:3-oxoacyl-[acyl-carrier-protein] synthase II
MHGTDSIVVTGLGLISPLGHTLPQAWENLSQGRSGIAECTQYSLNGHDCRSSAAIAAYPLTKLRAPKNQKFMSPGARHLMQAAYEALNMAGVRMDAFDSDRVAILSGSGQVGPEPSEFFKAFGMAALPDGTPDWEQLGGLASRLVDPYFPLRTLSNAGLALLAMELGARGPTNNFVQTDISSALALEAACRDLSEGRCDLALAAGFDYLLAPATFLAFEKEGLLSSLAPDRALRAFDRDADGLVLGEGAAVAVLERKADAERRSAKPLVEIAGCATAGAAEDEIAPFTGADQVIAAIERALGGDQPDFVSACGFGVPLSDRREAAILSSAVGNSIPVTAWKGYTGYLGAATALAEIVLGANALMQGLVPPVCRHAVRADGIDLNIVSSGPAALRSGGSGGALFIAGSWAGSSTAVYVRLPRAGGIG